MLVFACSNDVRTKAVQLAVRPPAVLLKLPNEFIFTYTLLHIPDPKYVLFKIVTKVVFLLLKRLLCK